MDQEKGNDTEVGQKVLTVLGGQDQGTDQDGRGQGIEIEIEREIETGLRDQDLVTETDEGQDQETEEDQGVEIEIGEGGQDHVIGTEIGGLVQEIERETKDHDPKHLINLKQRIHHQKGS